MKINDPAPAITKRIITTTIIISKNPKPLSFAPSMVPIVVSFPVTIGGAAKLAIALLSSIAFASSSLKFAIP